MSHSRSTQQSSDLSTEDISTQMKQTMGFGFGLKMFDLEKYWPLGPDP